MATAQAPRPSLQTERSRRPSLQIDTRARPSLQIDTRPSFQLFPPPPKYPPPSLAKPVQRQDSLRLASRSKVEAPKPAAQAPKKPTDFHELIIRVDSPNSVSTIAAPPKVHITPSPPQQSAPGFLSQGARAPSPTPISPAENYYSPDHNKQGSWVAPVSPPNQVQSSYQQEVSNSIPGPSSESWRAASPVPTEKGKGRLISDMLSPESKRAPSPAFSDIQSLKSAGPGLARSNTVTTSRTLVEPPPMRSMFPQYDFNKPLSQQQYYSSQAIPESIPMQKISKAPYSPEAVGFSSASREPYFTPAKQLEGLWDAANGKMQTVSPRLFTLQVRADAIQKSPKSAKSPKSKSSRKTQISFGPGSQGFYSIALAESRTTDEFLETVEDNEVLVLRHHPSDPNSLPVAHLNVIPPPHLSTISRNQYQSSPYMNSIASPNASLASPAFAPSLQEAVYHVTNIFSKLAALQALENAANSPEAAHIAQIDPNATSPAAAQLAENAVRDAEDQESCDLLWVATAAGGRYELRHPSMGRFPIRVEGDVGKRFRPEPVGNATYVPYAQARVSVYAPEQESVIRGNNEPLASLDLVTGALTLDAAAMQELGNAYLIDTISTVMFAVAVSELKRGDDPALVFAAPPMMTDFKGKGKNKADSLKAPSMKAASVKKLKAKAKEVIQDNYDLEAARQDKELPKATRGILSILGLGLKLVVWILQLGVKILARIIVGLSSRHTK